MLKGSAALFFFGALMVAAACAPTGSTGGTDTGTRPPDSGRPPPGDCGVAGRTCCAAPDECREGLRCQGAGTCCAPPRSSCRAPEECCSGFDCAGGNCCAPADGRCRSRDDCCSGLTCESGRCSGAGSTDCGGRGQLCCPGSVCRSADIGLECRLAPDSEGNEELKCLPCGQSGGPCCKSPNEPCSDGLACGTDRTCGVPPAGCGHDGEPCCARDECVESGLSCRSGTCRPQVAECDLAIDCDECLEVIGCGYCADFDTCESGDTIGPAVGSCSDWNSTPEMCGGGGGTDRCAANTDCDDCTFEAGCGWCDDGTGCRSGNSEGPSAGSCGSWDWFGYACGSDTCAGYRSCETCTNVSDLCGWCAGARTCHDASGLGVPDVGTCDGTFVEWPLECTTGPAPCRDITDCVECADHPECGWCADSGLCLPSDLDGRPEIGTCRGPLAVFDSECPTTCIPNSADACDPSGLSCCDGMSCRTTVSGAGLSACCREAGAACSSGSDCCGYMDCGGDGSCECRGPTRACLDNADCCTGFCSFGVCG